MPKQALPIFFLISLLLVYGNDTDFCELTLCPIVLNSVSNFKRFESFQRIMSPANDNSTSFIHLLFFLPGLSKVFVSSWFGFGLFCLIALTISRTVFNKKDISRRYCCKFQKENFQLFSTEFWALCMLGKHSTTELHPQTPIS